MLFLLTGEIQTGKTRWLQRLLVDLEEAGILSCGVIAPGIWREDGPGSFEKLGIENVLLPQGPRIPFASRCDLLPDDCADRQGQSFKAGLGWSISEDALVTVNRHFENLPAVAGASLLVVDELGWLELVHGGGLSGAIDILQRGPSASFPHAIVVVRKDLLGAAHALLDASWGEVMEIYPDGLSRDCVLSCLRSC